MKTDYKARKTPRARTVWLAVAFALLAAAFAVTYGTRPSVSFYAFPMAITFAVIVLLIPRSASGGTPGNQYYSASGALMCVITGVVVGAGWGIAMSTVPMVAPRTDITMTLYQDLSWKIDGDPKIAALLEPAAADGRIDMREMAQFNRDVRRTRDQEIVDDVISTARTSQ